VEDPNLPFSNSKLGHKKKIRICPAIQLKHYSEVYPYMEF
jgi:hypothetical protein